MSMHGMKFKKADLIGEVSIDFLKDLEEKLREIDENYRMTFLTGNIIIKKTGGSGRPFKSTSINKINDYVTKKLKEN